MPLYIICKKKNSWSDSIQHKEQGFFQKSPFNPSLSKSHPLTGKGAPLQGVRTEKYTAPCSLFIAIRAVNSLILNATRHTYNLLFLRPDLCFISKSPTRWKTKEAEGERETAMQQKLFFFSTLPLWSWYWTMRKRGFLLRNFPMRQKRSVSSGSASIFSY